jgi:hypothetical protein
VNNRIGQCFTECKVDFLRIFATIALLDQTHDFGDSTVDYRDILQNNLIKLDHELIRVELTTEWGLVLLRHAFLPFRGLPNSKRLTNTPVPGPRFCVELSG